MSKWVFSSFIAILLLSTILGSQGASASSLKDWQNEMKLLEEKKNNLNSTIDQKESEINDNKSTINTILDKIATLNGKISETSGNIERAEAEIAQTTEEIDKLRLSIEELEKKIAERDVVLRERIRAMQVKGGSVDYIDVLLGANSFADFIDRFSAVSTLMDADRNIMKQQADDQKLLEEEQAEVEQKLTEQENNRANLNKLKADLESQKSQNATLVDQLEAEQAKLVVEKTNLETDYHETVEVSKEVEAKIVAEQKRMAEIARKAAAKKKAEADAARKRAAANKGSTSNSMPAVSNGTWTRPAAGGMSSQFGYRKHPIYGDQRQHRGLDVSNRSGTPIVAAGDGVVSVVGGVGSIGGYGNVVMITHSVGNQIYTTLYAHLSSIGVSKGQHVSKGQRIGAMGSTGDSTGPHLHFELHVGNWSGSGSSAVNPLRHIPF